MKGVVWGMIKIKVLSGYDCLQQVAALMAEGKGKSRGCERESKKKKNPKFIIIANLESYSFVDFPAQRDKLTSAHSKWGIPTM